MKPIPYLMMLSLQAMITMGAAAEDTIAKLQVEMRQAQQAKQPAQVVASGQRLVPLLEAKGDLAQACEAAVMLAFAADQAGKPDETIAATLDAVRLIGMARPGMMRPWDFMLQAQLSGIGVKNLIAAGRLTSAQSLQRDAWKFIAQAIKLETGKVWVPDQPIPTNVSRETMDILLRNVRYDVMLLCSVGRNVEAVAKIRALEASLPPLAKGSEYYRFQLLNELSNELKFLGYWKDCQATLASIVQNATSGSAALSARFNKVYWKAAIEGPDPELLATAKAIRAEEMLANHASSNRLLNRLLAKMAFAYKEAGFDVGDLEKLIAESLEAGDQMEAIYARRDLAVIQAELQDFPTAEKNLLATLASLREIGKKTGEPTIYREYGQLLVQSGRPREGIAMIREAIRLTKAFRWTQHLPSLLHLLAQGQAAAGDTAGLRATLTELTQLLATGQLEPERRLNARVAMALCHQALGQTVPAQTALKLAFTDGQRDGLSKWQLEWAEKFPLSEVKLAPPTGVAVKPVTDLQPRHITSAVLPDESARVRFTLSNPSAEASSGILRLTGEHLAATWDHESGTAHLQILAAQGDQTIAEKVTLLPGEEFLLVADAKGPREIKVGWEPTVGVVQQSRWKITPGVRDGCDVAITNASLAGRNPFYALRLHHAFTRRSGDAGDPVNFRLTASRPVRLELLNALTGDLLAVDANGNGDLTQAGDLLIADQDADGAPDLAVPELGPVELAVLVYPLSASDPQGEITLKVQIKDAKGWQDAAQDLLR